MTLRGYTYEVKRQDNGPLKADNPKILTLGFIDSFKSQNKCLMEAKNHAKTLDPSLPQLRITITCHDDDTKVIYDQLYGDRWVKRQTSASIRL